MWAETFFARFELEVDDVDMKPLEITPEMAVVHALTTRGGWNAQGQWIPVPFIDPHAAELLFRHKILQLLKTQGLISNERIELLLSWKHTGFSAHALFY